MGTIMDGWLSLLLFTLVVVPNTFASGAFERVSMVTRTSIQAAQLVSIVPTSQWLGKSVSEIEAIVGQPLSTFNVPAGERPAAPNGGEIRRYQQTWGMLEVLFADGQAVRLELGFEQTRPASIDDALRQLGLPTRIPPTTSTVGSSRWRNLNGHFVYVMFDPDNGEVSTVAITDRASTGPTRTRSQNPSDVARPSLQIRQVLGGTAAEIENTLGQPLTTATLAVGERPAAPNGGEIRRYQQPWGVLEVLFADGRAAELTWSFEQVQPAGVNEALSQFGLPTSVPPTSSTTASRHWANLGGYTVDVVTSDSTQSVVSVRVQPGR
jgi:hypothetical protein